MIRPLSHSSKGGAASILLAVLSCLSLVAASDRQTATNSASNMSQPRGLTLFDFTARTASVNDWEEQSDVKRTVGMSKATLVLQETQVFQRAVFFTLLNPQPNGAGFAGMRTTTSLDLRGKSKLLLHCRAQGQNYGYKVVLRHRGLNDEPNPSYEQIFEAPKEFSTVELPLQNFLPYFRGKQVKDIPLDKSNITNIGLQVYGGVYMSVKQSGVSSLEIDWISAE